MNRLTVALLLAFATYSCSDSGESATDRVDELVFINSGAVQCESEGRLPEETAQTLIDAGIDVLASWCGYRTDIAVTTVCGASTTQINIHRINAQNVTDAEALGFTPVTELVDNEPGEAQYQTIDCSDR